MSREGEVPDGLVTDDVRLVSRFRDYWELIREGQRNRPEIPGSFQALGSTRDRIWPCFTADGQLSNAEATTRPCPHAQRPLDVRPGRGTMEGLLFPSGDPDLLRFHRLKVHSYLASALVESLGEVLLERGEKFTFETVMSHQSKVEILRRAQDPGYRAYLNFVATEDVEINVARVENRVEPGGHPVPEDKFRSRYQQDQFDFLRSIGF